MSNYLAANGLEGTAEQNQYGQSRQPEHGQSSMMKHQNLPDQMNDERLRAMQTLNNCLSTAEETNQIATSTAEMLSAQGEQIKKIQRESKQIEQNLDVSEKLIDSLGSWFGTISGMFTMKQKPPEKPVVKSVVEECGGDSAWNKAPKTPPKPAQVQPRGLWGVTKSSETSFDSEFNSGIDSLSNLLMSTGAQAKAMNSELKTQSSGLKSVYEQSEQHRTRIASQQKKMSHYMGS